MKKQVNRINNRIITLKMHNSNNNTTGNSLLKTTFIKKSQHIHYQFVVAPIDKANRNVAFICKSFYIEVLIEVLGIDTDGVSNNSDTYSMPDIYVKLNFFFNKFLFSSDLQTLNCKF